MRLAPEAALQRSVDTVSASGKAPGLDFLVIGTGQRDRGLSKSGRWRAEARNGGAGVSRGLIPRERPLASPGGASANRPGTEIAVAPVRLCLDPVRPLTGPGLRIRGP